MKDPKSFAYGVAAGVILVYVFNNVKSKRVE